MLDSSGKVPERNKRAVTEAIRRGVIVTISTGRMFQSAALFARQLGISDVPIICYNGAMITRLDGKTLLHLKLDTDVARELLSIFKERRIYVQSYINGSLYVRENDDLDYVNYAKYFGVDGIAIGNDLFNPSEQPTKLLAKTNGPDMSRALVKELAETFGDRIHVTSSNEDFVEIMNSEACKGKSLRKLADMLGISMENVMALGDGCNDSAMIGAAGVGVAMSNARDGTKALAQEIAPANDECGAAWAIEKYVLV
jgi:Cof subfamily protein (haloacid dehalogenase superfamily)